MPRPKKFAQASMAARDNLIAKPAVHRNRASLARLIKLYEILSEPQKEMIHNVGFGGLLQIACDTIPGDFANWLMVECFDAEACELVLPGRGKVAVTAESVHNIMGLPIGGDDVKYELQLNAINWFHKAYGITSGTAPKIQAVIMRIEGNKAANEDFLRTWLMIAVSTFLCPPTSLGISPRCYPPLLDLSSVSKLNWCQFVVDRIKSAALKMNKRNSVKGCLLFLVILYVDSLEVQNVEIPATNLRIAAWNRKLLDKIIKLDTNTDGSFGKLKLKPSGHFVLQNSLVQMDDIRRFVSLTVPACTSNIKKRKVSQAVGKFFSSITDLLGSFLQDLSSIEDSPEPSLRRSKRRRMFKEETIEVDTDTDSDSEYKEDEADNTVDDVSEGNDHGDEDTDESSDNGEQYQNDGPENVSLDEQDDEEDNVPLIHWLRKVKPACNDQHTSRATSNDPESHPTPPVCVPCASERELGEARELGDADRRRARLRLPIIQTEAPRTLAHKCCNTEPQMNTVVEMKDGCSSKSSKSPSGAYQSTSLNFSPPECSILKFVNLECIDNQSHGKTDAHGQQGDAERRRARLRLPSTQTEEPPMEANECCNTQPPTTTEHPSNIDLGMKDGCSSKHSQSPNDAHQSNSLDFSPPECNIPKFVNLEYADSQSHGKTNAIYDQQEPGSAWSWDALPDEVYQKMEDDAIRKLEEAKANNKANNIPPVGGTTEVAATPKIVGPTPKETTQEPMSLDSSVTPLYQPPPRRLLKKAAVMVSPYAQFAPKRSFKCSSFVTQFYHNHLLVHICIPFRPC